MNPIQYKAAALFAALSLASAAHALQPMVAVEKSYETNTFALSLPTRVPSRLAVRACDSCPAQTVQVTQETQFFIKREEVTLTRFSQYAKERQRNMVVHYAPETLLVTRVVATE